MVHQGYFDQVLLFSFLLKTIAGETEQTSEMHYLPLQRGSVVTAAYGFCGICVKNRWILNGFIFGYLWGRSDWEERPMGEILEEKILFNKF